MQPGGQSLVDRLLAAKNTIAGQALAKVVCKATTEEIMGPKRKHLDFLLQATNEMNVSIPQLADLLIERTQNSSWVVSFKALITIHHLMCFGNERFEAYMASHNHRLQPASYLDRMGMPGGDMSNYIRRYASYLNEKRESYKLMGYDFCKIKRGKDDGVLRTMPTEKLLKALPILQKQLDALLEFDVTPNELTNGVINSCFFLLIKDLIRLYAAFNDGMINLLEKYFDMNKKQCREALDIYKKFLDRTDKVSNFLKVAETSGMERSEIPDLSRAPSSLLEALENHLAHMEGKKISQTSISRQQTEQDLKSFSRDLIFNDSDDPQKILEEEAKALAQFNKSKDSSSPSAFTQSTATTSNNFGDTDFFSQQTSSNGQHAKPSTTIQQQQLLTDDLFSLATPPAQTSTNSFFNNNQNVFPAFQEPPQHQQQQPFQNMLDTSLPRKEETSSIETSLASNITEASFFDDILQPTSMSSNKNPSTMPLFTNNQSISATNKPFQTGDLNSSLNQLLENLDMKDRSKIGKDHQWTPNEGKNQKIGMATGAMASPSTAWPNQPSMGAPFGGIGVQPTTMWQPTATPASTNPFAAPSGPSIYMMNVTRPYYPVPMGFGGMGARPMGAGTNPFAAQPQFGASPFGQQPKPNQQQVNDPFGNL
ncbi:unnamed protein product [Rotaria magnacalcarata]|uniref:ENTH domain-containing protein n=1 Tax=Rotaria magnacalcarata TaxID=392030 RepID=A0A816FTJ7_9BILA|nr:unnamed protein product [Rotaria magnacalcarata]CAF1665993.1 unnamed protein product [Rotaria magnacalcarata]CAF2048335.1 unnamed protein product [Rotaria magnacalcarata]CAF2078975.1 unnamed protein product [Rotaria magnacalcarata]